MCIRDRSYTVVNSFIRQQIEKGFAMYLYDFKFDDLSSIAYNHLLNHLDAVSYTHLDVYKRQTMNIACGSFRRQERAGPRSVYGSVPDVRAR